MKDRKNIIILVLLIVFIGLNFYVYLNNDTNNIYLGYYTKVINKKGKLSVINKNTKVNLTKAKIFFNGEFINGYLKSTKSKLNNGVTLYNAYNEDGTILRFNDDLIAYTGNKKISIANANVLDLAVNDDIAFIEDFLNSEYGNGITLNHNVSYVDYKKVTYDVNNDGDNEIIYSLDMLEESTSYTYVFMVDDGNINIIMTEQGNISKPDVKKVSFFNLIDFNNDGIYEIVIKIKTGDYGNNNYKIYNYDGKIKEIK